jgi:hypothetical protein
MHLSLINYAIRRSVLLKVKSDRNDQLQNLASPPRETKKQLFTPDNARTRNIDVDISGVLPISQFNKQCSPHYAIKT